MSQPSDISLGVVLDTSASMSPRLLGKALGAIASYAAAHDRAQDFPAQAPVLIITDGECEPLRVHRREHAYLVPRGARLPFTPRGEVFEVR